MPRMKLYDALLRDYVSRKVDEMIEDSIVPDVALEVINENSVKKDMDLYGSKVRGDITYVEGMVDRVVKGLARVVVQETIDGITNE